MSAPPPAAAHPGFEHPDTVLCPGGPMLLRGDHLVDDADGVAHRTTRPVSAVCRCQRSTALPWCDGTHKRLPAHLRPDAPVGPVAGAGTSSVE